MNPLDLTQYISFESQQWQVLTQYLSQLKESKVGLLVASTDHDESNRIRGAISVINQLLALNETARNSPSR